MIMERYRKAQKLQQELESARPSVISLFTCCMGMDLGFARAGFSTRYANDIAQFAFATIKANRPDLPCDMEDIANIPSADILKRASLNWRETDVVIGGPPVPILLHRRQEARPRRQKGHGGARVHASDHGHAAQILRL